ncbi:MMPL family transporter [Pilimelia columellifera]|uniref:MMPL family transporter n=1 Tax=Pilimelia columellifera subsp. columellifera TaxID=706583 RepID=A0ABN3N3E2_9ACTN
MFTWWGRAVVRFRWLVLVAGLLVMVAGGSWGLGVFDRLSSGGFEDPTSEASRTRAAIEATFGDQSVDFLLLYSRPDATVDQPALRDPVVAATARLRAQPQVDQVVSYYDAPPGSPATAQLAPLASQDRHATYVTVRLRVADEDGKSAAYAEVRDIAEAGGGVETTAGGVVAFQKQVTERTIDDLFRAEIFSLPVLLLLLLLIFGGLVAASTPLLIGGLAVLGSFVTIRLLTAVIDISIFSINVITLIGMGMAIDYALFMVSRFREEMDAGRDVADAVARTVATAGRTIMVSGLTIALALASLLIFPQPFLKSMGLGGMSAVLVAMLGALTVLPALLAVLGPKINALRAPTPWRRRLTVDRPVTSGVWARIAHSVMRRPALYAIGVTAVLLALAIPVFRMSWGGFDERIMPVGTEARVASERIKAEFPGGSTDPIVAFVAGAQPAELSGYVSALRALPQVTGAQVTQTTEQATLVSVSYAGEPTSVRAQELVDEVRAVDAPAGAKVLVGGRTANDVDLLDSLRVHLPWMAALMAAATLVLLFLAFGSILLPIKAVLMNLISIGASFGVIVWGFQDGHLADLLGFTATGTIEPTNPIIMLAVLFGLATDYEVFLLSRVREEWDATGDNTAAVARGLQHTGRIITAAALLLILVVAGFAGGSITMIKMVGVGMIVAILVDATLVRIILVPATMRLLGRWNWWAPGPMSRFYDRFGIRESDGEREPAPADPELARV